MSVIGKDKQIPYYEQRAKTLGLSAQVHFFGPQQQIRPFYQLADTLVIPSHYDPFANVTVEALAMGLFVVSSKNNGGHEVLEPHTGAVIPSLNDPEAFAATLKSSLKHKKTHTSAAMIRASVRHLDFGKALERIVAETFY